MQLGQPNIGGSLQPGAQRAAGQLQEAPPPEPFVAPVPAWRVALAMIPVVGWMAWTPFVNRVCDAYGEATGESIRGGSRAISIGLTLLMLAGSGGSWFLRSRDLDMWAMIAAVVSVAALVLAFALAALRTWKRLRGLAERQGIAGAPSRFTTLVLAPLLYLVPPIPVLYQRWILRQAVGSAEAGPDRPVKAENVDLSFMAAGLLVVVFGMTFAAIMLPPRVQALVRDDNGSCLTVHASPSNVTREEHVWLRNRCGDARNLGGWSISYPDGERFLLRDTVLEHGERLRVFTGGGSNTEVDRHLERSSMLLSGRTDGTRLMRRNGSVHTDSAASQDMYDVVLPSWYPVN